VPDGLFSGLLAGVNPVSGPRLPPARVDTPWHRPGESTSSTPVRETTALCDRSAYYVCEFVAIGCRAGCQGQVRWGSGP
jgi:hypothetical protein